MLNLIEEEDDGKWGYDIRRFLSHDIITNSITMRLPHGIILNTPIVRVQYRMRIMGRRKRIEAPHPTFHTVLNTKQHAGNKRPLHFRSRDTVE